MIAFKVENGLGRQAASQTLLLPMSMAVLNMSQCLYYVAIDCYRTLTKGKLYLVRVPQLAQPPKAFVYFMTTVPVSLPTPGWYSRDIGWAFALHGKTSSVSRSSDKHQRLRGSNISSDTQHRYDMQVLQYSNANKDKCVSVNCSRKVHQSISAPPFPQTSEDIGASISIQRSNHWNAYEGSWKRQRDRKRWGAKISDRSLNSLKRPHSPLKPQSRSKEEIYITKEVGSVAHAVR